MLYPNVRGSIGYGKKYMMADNCRPISLLLTLGKALKSLVAERIEYLVEEYSLLPNTHFGVRKRCAEAAGDNTCAVAPLRGRV